MNLRIAVLSTFQDSVRNVERELNLLRRDALEMGLEKANVWAEFVDWPLLQKMSEGWRPLEARIRDTCLQVREAKEGSEALSGLRDSLADIIEQVERTIGPLNTQLICGLGDSLKRLCACP